MAATVTDVGVGFSFPCSSKLTTQTTPSCSMKMVMVCVEEKQQQKLNNFTLKKSEEAFIAHGFKIAYSYELIKTVQKLGTSSIKCKMIHTQLRKEKTMESSSFTRTPTSLITSSSCTPTKQISEFPASGRYLCLNQNFLSYSTTLYATLNSPRGFGPTPKI